MSNLTPNLLYECGELSVTADGSGNGVSGPISLGMYLGVTFTFAYAGGGTPVMTLKVSNDPASGAALRTLQSGIALTDVAAPTLEKKFAKYVVTVAGMQNNDAVPLKVYFRLWR